MSDSKDRFSIACIDKELRGVKVGSKFVFTKGISQSLTVFEILNF
jgi:hypothetical protein